MGTEEHMQIWKDLIDILTWWKLSDPYKTGGAFS